MACILPPAYSSDELPDYSQSREYECSPAYSALTLTSTRSSMSSLSGPEVRPQAPQTGRFVFGSKCLTLDLGQQHWGIQLPAYGRGALIKGHVEVKTFKHVDRIQLTLTGVVYSTCMMSNSNPSLRSSKIVLSDKSTIWSVESDSRQSNDRCPGIFPFAFALPEYSAGSGPDEEVNTPLPPSAVITTRSTGCHVFYLLKVDMFRRGVRFHDSVQTEILYLPRTTSRYEAPYIPLPGSEKLRQICDSDWCTSSVPLKPSRTTPNPVAPAAFPDVDVHLSLPCGINYPSGCSIPFAVTLSGPGLSCANIPQLTAGLKITLVKTSTVTVRGMISTSETEVSVGSICHIGEGEPHWRNAKPGGNSRQIVVRGCLEMGAKGQDQTWEARGFAGVSYLVRVILAPALDSGRQIRPPIWEYDEAVDIASHEWERGRPDSIPALSLAASSLGPGRFPRSFGRRILAHRTF